MIRKLLICCLITSSGIANAQFGTFAQGSFETFYTWNRMIVVGAQFKEHKLGLFHQEAKINGEGYYIRQGIYGEIYFGNVDGIAYVYGGFRLAQSNDNFFGFTPHGTVAWRLHKNVEIPQTISVYASRLVASIGVRIMFKGTPKRKVQNTQRRTLQPTTLDPKPKF